MRTVTLLRENVECPSLSPDERRIAFKKRSTPRGRSMWRLSVLDLAMLADIPLASSFLTEVTNLCSKPLSW